MSTMLGIDSTADYWAINATQLYATIATASESGNLDSLSIHIKTNPGVSTLIRLGVYSDNGSNLPSSLLLDAGTVDVNGGGTKTISGLTLAITNGVIYWIGCIGDPTTAAWTYSDTSSDVVHSYRDQSSSYSTFPSTFPASPTASMKYRWSIYGMTSVSVKKNIVRMLI